MIRDYKTERFNSAVTRFNDALGVSKITKKYYHYLHLLKKLLREEREKRKCTLK